MFHRFMIVCWVLFTISALASAGGFLTYKISRDAALEMDTAAQPVDSEPDVYYVRVSLTEDQAKLEKYVAAGTELDRRYTERGDSEDPTTVAENREKLERTRLALENVNKAVKRLAKLESRLNSGAATGVFAGIVATAFLLWNLFCHTVAWVIAGRTKPVESELK